MKIYSKKNISESSLKLQVRTNEFFVRHLDPYLDKNYLSVFYEACELMAAEDLPSRAERKRFRTSTIWFGDVQQGVYQHKAVIVRSEFERRMAMRLLGLKSLLQVASDQPKSMVSKMMRRTDMGIVDPYVVKNFWRMMHFVPESIDLRNVEHTSWLKKTALWINRGIAHFHKIKDPYDLIAAQQLWITDFEWAITFPYLVGGQLRGLVMFTSEAKFHPEGPLYYQEKIRPLLDSFYAGHIEKPMLNSNLQLSTQQKEAILNTIPDGIYLSDGTRTTFANPQALQLLGVENLDALNQKPHQDWVIQDDRELANQDIAQIIGGSRIQRQEIRMLRADGRSFWAELEASPFPLAGGNGILAIIRDITDRKVAAEKLRELNIFFYQALNKGFKAQMAVFDKNLRYVFVNELSVLNPDDRERMIGMNDEEYCQYKGRTAEIARKRKEVMRAAIEEKTEQVFLEFIQQPDGKPQYMRRIYNPVFDENSGELLYLFGFGVDVTELELHKQKIATLAYEDFLTQLPNRARLIELVNDSIERCRKQTNHQSIGLLLINMNDFEGVNKVWGHQGADQLLKDMAHRLSLMLEPGQVLARIGNDEFGILFDQIKPEVVEQTARKLIEGFEEYPLLAYYPISFRMGGSCCPAHGQTADDLFNAANAAMKEARTHTGSAFKLFSQEISIHLKRAKRIEQDIAWAIEQKQFQLEYQPQVDNEGQIVGAEALLRWHHPELGQISPDQFIPIAENSADISLIWKIFDWVLATTCAQAKVWGQMGFQMPIAINVSPFQFIKDYRHPEEAQGLLKAQEHARHQGLSLNETLSLKVYREILKNHLPPSAIEIEITEGENILGIDSCKRAMAELRSMGITVALDDLGEGRTNLMYLVQLPFNKLKLDRVYMRQISENLMDRNGFALLKAIIQLALDTDRTVIVEGVENELHRGVIDELLGLQPLKPQDLETKIKKIVGLQGWGFSRAVSADQMQLLLQQKTIPFHSLG